MTVRASQVFSSACYATEAYAMCKITENKCHLLQCDKVFCEVFPDPSV